jgi:diacylglycerol kinase
VFLLSLIDALTISFRGLVACNNDESLLESSILSVFGAKTLLLLLTSFFYDMFLLTIILLYPLILSCMGMSLELLNRETYLYGVIPGLSAS